MIGLVGLVRRSVGGGLLSVDGLFGIVFLVRGRGQGGLDCVGRVIGIGRVVGFGRGAGGRGTSGGGGSTCAPASSIIPIRASTPLSEESSDEDGTKRRFVSATGEPSCESLRFLMPPILYSRSTKVGLG